MKKVNIRKMLSIFTIFLIFFCNTTAYASDTTSNTVSEINYVSNPMLRASDYIAAYTLRLGCLGEGKLEVIASLTAFGKITEVKIGPLILQESTDCLKWTDVTSWSKSELDTSYTSISTTYQGVVGRYYRLTCTYTAKSGNATETRNLTLNSLYNAKAVN